MTTEEILEQVKKAAAKRILYLSHALNQMNSSERMISVNEVRAVVWEEEVVEDYPEDIRGHSCLLLGWGDRNRPIHVVCAPKSDYLAVITAYLPNLDQWESDWRTRRKL